MPVFQQLVQMLNRRKVCNCLTYHKCMLLILLLFKVRRLKGESPFEVFFRRKDNTDIFTALRRQHQELFDVVNRVTSQLT